MKKDKTDVLIMIVAIEILVAVFLLSKLNFLSLTGKYTLIPSLPASNDSCFSNLFSTPPEEYKKLDDESFLNRSCLNNFFQDLKNSTFVTELVPNYVGCFDGFQVKVPLTTIEINSDGFRDREYSLEKPNNTKRIIALGDSFTFPLGVNVSDGWPKVLEKLLNSNQKTSLTYEVLDMGVIKYDMREYVEMYKAKGIKYNPDVIIVGYVGNDVNDEREILKIRDSQLNRLVTNNMSNADKIKLDFIVSVDAELEYNKEISNNFPFFFNKNVGEPLDELHNLTENKNITVIIVSFMPQHTSSLKNATKDFKNFYIMDLIPEFINEAKNNGYCAEDLQIHELDAHPNKLAHHIFGELIYKFLLTNTQI